MGSRRPLTTTFLVSLLAACDGADRPVLEGPPDGGADGAPGTTIDADRAVAADSACVGGGLFDAADGAHGLDVDGGPVDLRAYLAPTGEPRRYRLASGALYATYVFAEATPDFQRLYESTFDQGLSGRLVTWQKIYDSPAPGCTSTYAQLWLGDDLSVTEVGDWFATDGCSPSIAFGYRTLDHASASGLVWSSAGGLTAVRSSAREVAVFYQRGPGGAYEDGGAEAYSRVVLLERFAQWTAPYGRGPGRDWEPGAGRTYDDVVRVLFYHGVRDADLRAGLRRPMRCSDADYDPTSPLGALVLSFSDYESYAIELHLARGRGIVREALGFNETGYWGAANICRGAFMGRDADASTAAWAAYLDE